MANTEDYKAHSDYWQRQAELHPEDMDVLIMRTLVAADYLIHLAVVDWFNSGRPELEQ